MWLSKYWRLISKKSRKLFAISKWNWKRDKKDFCHSVIHWVWQNLQWKLIWLIFLRNSIRVRKICENISRTFPVRSVCELFRKSTPSTQAVNAYLWSQQKRSKSLNFKCHTRTDFPLCRKIEFLFFEKCYATHHQLNWIYFKIYPFLQCETVSFFQLGVSLVSDFCLGHFATKFLNWQANASLKVFFNSTTPWNGVWFKRCRVLISLV